MEAIKLSKSSWMYKFIKFVGDGEDSYKLNKGVDTCQLRWMLINNVIMVSLMMLITFMLFYTEGTLIANAISYYFDLGWVFTIESNTINELAIWQLILGTALCILLGILSILDRYDHYKRLSKESDIYASWKNKYCKRVELVD